MLDEPIREDTRPLIYLGNVWILDGMRLFINRTLRYFLKKIKMNFAI